MKRTQSLPWTIFLIILGILVSGIITAGVMSSLHPSVYKGFKLYVWIIGGGGILLSYPVVSQISKSIEFNKFSHSHKNVNAEPFSNNGNPYEVLVAKQIYTWIIRIVSVLIPSIAFGLIQIYINRLITPDISAKAIAIQYLDGIVFVMAMSGIIFFYYRYKKEK